MESMQIPKSVKLSDRKSNSISVTLHDMGFWFSVNQGLATLAFFGVGVNLVLFLTRVLQQNNADAANSVSKWTGTVYIFSLVGAFVSDSYWGRYRTCAIFQVIFVLVSIYACTLWIEFSLKDFPPLVLYVLWVGLVRHHDRSRSHRSDDVNSTVLGHYWACVWSWLVINDFFFFL